MDQEEAKDEPTAYKERKVSAAALRNVQKLNEDFSKESSANKRNALIGFGALLAVLTCFYIYGVVLEEPPESKFQFDGKVIELGVDVNSGVSVPGKKRIKVISEQLGQVEAMVSKDIYEGLKIGDEIKISPTRRGENPHFKVIEKSSQRAR